MEEIILETKELCKQYHKQTVLKNINMRIPKGCVYGLLGANGAGKSTLMKILCGMTRAAAGKKQTIQFECENLPKWICVNEKLLIRSWENLVYNAIEYTPQGGMIRICISEGNEQLEISVEDEGSGFSAEDLQSAKKTVLSGRQKQTFQETLRDGLVSGRAICKRKRRKSCIGQLYEDERSMGKTADCERIPEISNCKSLKNDIEYKRNLI